ncbi:MAG: phytanoyl-CoA dioxygenase family protein [Caldilineaceae bacterium]|nr:phytanoyl-CoA dioxygenase family protein [Caldilineaceae bacterium]
MMDIETILAECGVTDYTISQRHRDELDELGYTVFHNVIDPAWLAELCETFERLIAEEGDRAGSEVSQPHGIRRLADLVNKGTVFDRIYTHPVVLAAAYHVIQRPFKLVSLNGHDPLPGHGQQNLHSDFGGVRGDGRGHQTNALWMLDDLTSENGATRVVPGSHRWPAFPKDEMADLKAAHPQEVHITGPAGSVAFFNGQVWHGSTTNHTEQPRRVYHCAFTARENPQQTDQRAYLREETAARLSPAARYILDV